MIDPTVLEVLFMGFEGETSAFEALKVIQGRVWGFRGSVC